MTPKFTSQVIFFVVAESVKSENPKNSEQPEIYISSVFLLIVGSVKSGNPKNSEQREIYGLSDQP